MSKFPKSATAASVFVLVPSGGRLQLLAADLVEQGQRVGGAVDQRVDHRRIAGQRNAAALRLALWRGAVDVADLRRRWEADRHRGVAHAIRGANWCRGIAHRRQDKRAESRHSPSP